MSNNKKIGIAVWSLGLALSLTILFCFKKKLTTTFWITFGFVCFAFISALVFQIISWDQKNSADEKLIKLSAITVSYAYIFAQIPICVVFALGAGVISFTIAIIVNSVVLVIAWVTALSNLVGNEHIQKVNNRQKDHHIEL